LSDPVAIYNLTHISDLDGMASAALLVHYYKIPIGNVIFAHPEGRVHENAMKVLSRIKSKNGALVISDIVMRGRELDKAAKILSSFKKNNNRVFWFDHHSWDGKDVSKLSKICDIMVVGENKDFCGAELVYNFLCKKDSFGDRLVEMAHLSDFALKSKSERTNHLVDKLRYTIEYLNSDNPENKKLRELVLQLSRGNAESRLVNGTYSRYIRETRAYISGLLKTARILKVNNVKIAVGFSRKLSHQEACMTMLEKLGCDVSVYIDEGVGHSSVRSIRDKKGWGVESTQIATEFSGGGHPLASGFTLEDSGYNLKSKADQEKIIGKIRKISERMYSNKVRYYNQNTAKWATR
jgi:oligoribonuclease NrnB/cAMP/cGMP phosphodiesterase (DHH superfamily)